MIVKSDGTGECRTTGRRHLGIAAGGHARAPHHRHVRSDVPGHRRLIWRRALGITDQPGWRCDACGLPGSSVIRGRASPTRQAAVSEQPFRRKSGGFPAGPGLDTAAGHGHRAACSASGQQGLAGRHERGRERQEQLLERGAAVGLTGYERPVDGGQREARELAGDWALWIAWRHPVAAGDPRAVLAAALSQILGRPVDRVASLARPRPLSQQSPSGPLVGVPHPPARP